MRPLRSFVPPLAAMLLASGSASAASTLIENSEIRFVSRETGAKVEGRFRRWKANFDFRPEDLAHSRANLEIELSSVDVADRASAALLARPRWLDTAHHPVARFATDTIRRTGADRYEFKGKLSLKGVSRDVVVPFTVTRDAAGNHVAKGRFRFSRTAFAVGEPKAEAGATQPDDTVAVKLRMVLPAAVA